MDEMGRFSIVFMGTPDFAVPTLRHLIAGPDHVSAVVTQPDRPKGRGRKLLPSPVKQVALEAGLRIMQPARIKDATFVEEIRRLSPDLFIVAAFGQILPETLLDIPSIMPINIHGSLLPALRGAAPVQWALLHGLDKTGITIMKMDRGMDTGDILLQEALSIASDETFGSLFIRMAETGAKLLMQALDLLEDGRLEAVKQPEIGVSMAPPLKKDMFHIDWRLNTIELHRRIRAFDPVPGAWTDWRQHRIRLYHPFYTGMERGEDATPGTVLEAGPDGIMVVAGNGVIGVREIQYPGKKRMQCSDFLRGRPISNGERFG